MIKIQNENILVHHGILGMKWGVRRYQNPDGTLTAAGKKRYDKNSNSDGDKTPRNKITAKKVISDVKNAKNAIKEYNYEKGKERVKNGETLSKNSLKRIVASKALKSIGKQSLTWAKNRYDYGYGKASTVNALYAIGKLSYAASYAALVNGAIANHQIRTYYVEDYKRGYK